MNKRQRKKAMKRLLEQMPLMAKEADKTASIMLEFVRELPKRYKEMMEHLTP